MEDGFAQCDAVSPDLIGVAATRLARTTVISKVRRQIAG
jgi:hypothetical protein